MAHTIQVETHYWLSQSENRVAVEGKRASTEVNAYRVVAKFICDNARRISNSEHVVIAT